MANSQIANLTAGSIGLTDVIPFQDAAAAASAKKATVQSVSNLIKPYKSWVGILAQSGNNAPTATVLQNDLGGTITFAYSTIGVYTGTLTGAFTANKSVFMTSTQIVYSGTIVRQAAFLFTSVDAFAITTSSNFTNADGVLQSAPFITVEIRVYN